MQRNRILVTGGAGFIGSHTVDLLLQQGKQVTVLDNFSSGKLENLDQNQENLTIVDGDVLDFELVQKLMEECDAVLHLAALASVPASIENPIYSMRVNTQGFLHVLQAAHKIKHPIRVVYASSAAVYGNTKDLPCQEEFIEMPLSPYALQKINCEQYAELYKTIYGVKSLGLRYFNVYGQRQDPSSPYSGVISRFIDLYNRGDELVIHGDGMQSRDFIHVADVAEANLLALEHDYADSINIATGKPSTLVDLVLCIEKAGGKDAKYRFEHPRAGDIRSSYAATHMAKTGIGFTSNVSLENGIATMVQKA